MMHLRFSYFDNMTSNSFDPNQFKIGRDQIWDSAAQGYRTWWPHIEKAAQRKDDVHTLHSTFGLVISLGLVNLSKYLVLIMLNEFTTM